jgi:hypothetical protein
MKEMKSLHIPVRALPSEGISYVAGSTTRLRSLGSVILYFKDERNELVRIDFPKIYVSEPLEHDERTLSIFSTIPSMIGTDFLIANGFSFHFDPGKRTAYLESA